MTEDSRQRIGFFQCGGAVLIGLLALLPGCANVSDDPREGGLVGYWKHGDEGYQRRLDDRQGVLQEEEARGQQLQRQSRSLESERSSMRAELNRHRAEMKNLQSDLGNIERKVSKSGGSSPASARLLSDIRSKEGEVSSEMSGGSSQTLASLEAQRNRLEGEVAALKERARLLLEVQ